MIKHALERFLLLMMVLVFIGQLGFWYLSIFHRQEPMVLPEDPVAVEVRGHSLYANVPYCLDQESTLVVSRIWVNGVRYSTPVEMPHGIEAGCHTYNLALHIPDTLLPGEYHLETAVSIPVNPFATRTAHWNSEPFTLQ